jgi:hypothetical protein
MTANLRFVMKTTRAARSPNFKCATTTELVTDYRAGVGGVLVAFPLQGANVRRVRDTSLDTWVGRVERFADMNSRINRTGIE